MSDFAILMLALRAEANLSNRFRHDLSGLPSGTPVERIASGLYFSVRTPDGFDHAVRFPEYLSEAREALDLIGTRQHALGQKMLEAAHYRQTLCDIEVFCGGFDHPRAWVPSKTSCPSCVEAC